MDRYVLVVSFCPCDDKLQDSLAALQQIYDNFVNLSTLGSLSQSPSFPACSLSGNPSTPKWFFAVQACQGITQFCSSEWEELGPCHQKTDSEEEMPTTMDLCIGCLNDKEALDQKVDDSALTELLDEAAEGLHSLSDKLPPPGKALVDVLMLGSCAQPPAPKELLPLLGALKHMSCWHNAQITVATQHFSVWKRVASYLSAGLVEPSALDSCIDHKEVWRGGLLIREKKYVSELRFDGFSLRCPSHPISILLTPTEHKLLPEVFHYYASVLELVQLVSVSDLPNFLTSSTTFELGLSGKSTKAKLFLEQLRSLRGKVGALFILSCIVTPIIQPPANSLSSQRWREFLATGPKSLSVPETDVKGESSHYFLLVQGSDDLSGSCKVRMLNSDNQLNGSAAMATVMELLREPSLPATGEAGKMFRLLPCLQGDYMLRRERKVAQVQTLVLKEYLKKRQDTATVPMCELKALLNVAREQCLKVMDSSLPSSTPTDDQARTAAAAVRSSDFQRSSQQQTEWPERSVLHNIESMQRRRQKKRFGLLGPGSSDSLLGPKDGQKSSMALLDAKELLRHFTADGTPTGELQPLALNRGNNVFQLSPDVSPGKVRHMPFSKASATHYHGIEFCLDNLRSLDRDQSFVRLQSRLIRFETQTTCTKEPGALPFALSPAPSPSVMSEPGSVHDGEMLQNADVARLKRRSWDTEIVAGYPRKRLAKSESSDSLCSQSSGSSGTHPTIRSLRRQTGRSQSTTSALTSSNKRGSSSDKVNVAPTVNPKAPQQKPQTQTEDKASKESRSQKHNRMLQEVVAKTLRHHGISSEHKCFEACSKRLFDISKFYLKDLKTSRGLHEEMKKAASSNVKQVIDWVLEKYSKK
ncbi:mdm2-binding protein isoform X2 [Boleophthalmus pectinirostris]|uniref:mdm2-binding protein isoform X2 n=1 Tax=Boleophthalmus pectinirostris TaxID=150288 RepID=UPI002430A2D5|nr:mdm2-binding protein isoform X2 [Boleophthalmus pectinirostris]